MLEYHDTSFKTDHARLEISFADFLKSHKKVGKLDG